MQRYREEHSAEKLCVVAIDMTHMKLFNEWYGQRSGDALLEALGICPVPQDGGDGMTLCNCAQLDLYIWESVCKTLNKWKSEGGSRRPRG